MQRICSLLLAVGLLTTLLLPGALAQQAGTAAAATRPASPAAAAAAAPPAQQLCAFQTGGVPKICPKCITKPKGSIVFVLSPDYARNPSATWVWNEVKAGALRAAEPLGLTVDVRTPSLNGSAATSSLDCSVARQAALLIRRAAEEKPLGLVVTASDAPKCGRAIIPAMQAARAAGVPVIAIDQNGKAAVEEGGALHFVGADQAAAGRQLCGQLKADGAAALLFVDFDGGASPAINDRLDGCEAVMGGTRTSVVNVNGLSVENATALIAARLKANPLVNGVVMGGAWANAVKVLEGVVASSGRKPGKDLLTGIIRLGADGTASALKSGLLTYAVESSGQSMGFMPVVLHYAHAYSKAAVAEQYLLTSSRLLGKEGFTAVCATAARPPCGACGGAAAKAAAPATSGVLTSKSLCSWSMPAEPGIACAPCVPAASGSRVMYVIASPVTNPSDISKATPFWNQVQGGALQAGQAFGVGIDWRQPITTDYCKALDQAVAAVTEAVAAPPGPGRPLGIVATPVASGACGKDKLLPALASARKAGIPVVAINQNGPAALAAGAAQLYVGENGTDSGRQVCERFAAAGVTGVLMLDGAGRASNGINDRIAGCASVADLATYTLDVSPLRNTSAAAAAIAAQLSKRPDINAIMDAGGGNRADMLVAMLQASKRAGKAPGTGDKGPANIWLAVFDWHHTGLNAALAKGQVAVVVDQRSNSQGFLPVAAVLYNTAYNGSTGLMNPYLWTGPFLFNDTQSDMQCTSYAVPYCSSC